MVTTTTVLRGDSSLMRRSRVRPSPSGRLRSSRIRSGRARPSFAVASAALAASSQAATAPASMLRSPSRTIGWSSMISTRGLAGAGVTRILPPTPPAGGAGPVRSRSRALLQGNGELHPGAGRRDAFDPAAPADQPGALLHAHDPETVEGPARGRGGDAGAGVRHLDHERRPVSVKRDANRVGAGV